MLFLKNGCAWGLIFYDHPFPAQAGFRALPLRHEQDGGPVKMPPP
jgi:hypothetical protein